MATNLNLSLFLILYFPFLTTDEIYMQRCLQLAELGRGNVAPNPMVGAVLVYEGRIIGEGYHQQYGQAHAEVNCINSVLEKDKHLVEKATIYVSLEPCAHYGKTPPCADLIVSKKILKVVIGCVDPFAEVAGKGIKKIETAGIEVVVGVMEKESIQLNKRFFTFHQKKRPYIILKWAQTVDGFIGKSGERIMISNEYTNRLVHRWRSEESAILVGTNTALNDDPALTTRLWPGKNPVRCVIDKSLRLPPTLKLFNKEAKTIVFNFLKTEESSHIHYYKINKEQDFLKEMLKALHNLNIQSIIIEGGAAVLQSFIGAGLWDEARLITNSKLVLGSGIKAPELNNSEVVDTLISYSDTITTFIHKD